MWVIYWQKRLRLLWRFVKLIPRAQELEEECKAIQQKKHDIQFSSDIAPQKKEIDVAYQDGYHDGILHCIKKFWVLLFLALPLQAEPTKAILNPLTGKFDFITKLTSATIPSGSTNYIQNTVTPVSDVQRFSVLHGSFTTFLTTPRIQFSGRQKALEAEDGSSLMSFDGTFNMYTGEDSAVTAGGGFNACYGYTCMFPFSNGSFSSCTGAFCMSGTGYAGEQNNCSGYACMGSMTSGTFNICNGGSCMGSVTTATSNVCNGVACLASVSGFYNSCDGIQCLQFNTDGLRNSGLGALSGTAALVTGAVNNVSQSDMLYLGAGTAPGATGLMRAGVIGNFGIVNSSDTLAMRFSNLALVLSTGPAVSACGTNPAIYGNNSAFTVTVGATTTGCTVGFSQYFANTPTCVVSERTASIVNALSYTVGTTGMTFTQTAMGGSVLDVICIGGK